MIRYTELHALMAQLKPDLEGSVVQKVYEDQLGAFVLRVRRPGQTLYLLLSVDPKYGRAHWIDAKPKQPETPQAMTMGLRKWVMGMVVREVSVREDDRILTLSGDVADPDYEGEDRPPRRAVQLIAEWTGALTNLFVVDANTQLILCQRFPDQHPQGRQTNRPYVHPTPPPQNTQPVRWSTDTEDVSAWLVSHYREHIGEQRAQTLKKDAARRLKRHHKKLKRLVDNIEGDLQNAQDAQSYKIWGELLQGAYNDYQKGMASMTVTNYYDPDMGKVDVALDPAKSLQENIALYFKRYKRLHGAIDDIEERLLEAMTQVEEAEAARTQLNQLSTLKDLEAHIAQWTKAGILPKVRKQPKPGSKQAPTQQPYRTYLSSRGSTILVGRGSKGNDILSTKVARGRDIWFHARDWAGAHVILRMEKNQSPHDADMLEASMLAAYFSKGKDDTLIDVTWTQAKHIRKPKGYPPGMVTVAGGATRAVQLDEKRLEDLLKRQQPSS